jgi:hypothetical protein
MTMKDDERCCGSGTCIIDPAGRCWCGQQWDGEKMVAPGLLGAGGAAVAKLKDPDPLSAAPVDPQD